MRGAVEAAFRECDPQDFVLVQLAHANGLLGRELARMFSCSEAKISRDLERAKSKIAAATMGCVRAQDPLGSRHHAGVRRRDPPERL